MRRPCEKKCIASLGHVLMSTNIQLSTFVIFPCRVFLKEFSVGVPNAASSASALAGMLCPPPCSCLSLLSGLVSHLVWNAVSAPLDLSFSSLRSCLPACLPSGLECCVRPAGLVFLLSPVLSQLVFQLVWDAVSVLWACLQNFKFEFGVYGGVIFFTWEN